MAKKKLLIEGLNIALDNYDHEYLSSFRVQDENGNRLNVDALDCDAFPELDELPTDEQIDWARTKIGKYLFCDDLVSSEYRAAGKIYIV